MRYNTKLMILPLALMMGFTSQAWSHGISAVTAGALAVSSLSSTGTVLGTSATISAAVEKRFLAIAAVEDAAYYYLAGELRGVLPQVISRMREIEPELERMPDVELVDAVVEVAEQVLE